LLDWSRFDGSSILKVELSQSSLKRCSHARLCQ
jgi:hypothetical protein